LCLWKTNSQGDIPVNLNLSQTMIEPATYRASNCIQSTQSLHAKTTYMAGNEIVLNPGFEVAINAKFEALTGNDYRYRLSVITYNIKKGHYSGNGNVIHESGADVAAVQEIRFGFNNFKNLKNSAKMEGVGCATIGSTTVGYGIALLWKSWLGTPTICKDTVHVTDSDEIRGYIIAEWSDFAVISTHLSTNENSRKKMANKILAESIVQNCISTGKPIYFAGDANEEPHTTTGAVNIFNNAGFDVLNNPARNYQYNHNGVWGYWYDDATTAKGKMIDLIMEYNTNSNKELLERGIPSCADFNYVLSDHLPYLVKVKIQ